MNINSPHGSVVAAVVDNDQVIVSSRTGDRTLDYLPAGILSDPAYLLDGVGAAFDREGTLIVPHVPLSEWGNDPRPHGEQLQELRARAYAGGWQSTDAAIRHGSGWLTFTKTGLATVHLGIASAIDDHAGQLVVPGEPKHTAELLTRYRTATGVAWRTTAGVCGVSMIRALDDAAREASDRTGRQWARAGAPRWQWRDAPPIDGAGDLIWRREPTKDERNAANHVLHLDIRSMYLAAAGVAPLAVDAPEQTGPMEFDPTRAGFWRIRYGGRWANGQPPVLNPGRRASDGTSWVTSPVLAFLEERRIHPEIIDSYTSGRVARVLRSWAERLRDALALAPSAEEPRLRQALKDTYTYAIGLMGTGTALINRRDWRATIIDQARVNLLRKIERAGVELGMWPLEVRTDSVWYAVPPGGSRRLADSLGAGLGVGKFKIENSHDTLNDYLAARRPKGARRRG